MIWPALYKVVAKDEGLLTWLESAKISIQQFAELRSVYLDLMRSPNHDRPCSKVSLARAVRSTAQRLPSIANLLSKSGFGSDRLLI